MGTEIAKRDLPAPTPQTAKSLSPQERIDHRGKIASEVKVVLSAYFQPHEDERIKAAQLAWWCDELEDWTQEQVVWALRKWNRDNPRIRPTPGDVVAICKDARGRKMASLPKPPEAEPERQRVDKDKAAQILAEAGFAPKRFGGEE
jgi:hypothetical protein